MIWLLDLDNTLHNASSAIFPTISSNMNAFLSEYVKDCDDVSLSAEAVNQLRIAYWRRFGATLPGVSRVLDHRAKAFLKAAHQFDNLALLLDAEKGLSALFRKLPGRKLLLTNSAYSYSKSIVKLLGLLPYFEKLVSIESMRVFGQFEPKPSGKFFRKLLTMLKVRPEDCILVEDSCRILKKAKTIGMKTVWVTQYGDTVPFSGHSCPFPCDQKQSGRPMYVDLRISSVRDLTHYWHHFC